jgi:hypothetical protein
MPNLEKNQFKDRRLEDLAIISNTDKINYFENYDFLIKSINKGENKSFEPSEFSIILEHTVSWTRNLNEVKALFKISILYFIFIFLFVLSVLNSSGSIAFNMSVLANLPEDENVFKYLIIFLFTFLSFIAFLPYQRKLSQPLIFKMVFMLLLGAFLHHELVFMIWIFFILYLLIRFLKKMIDILEIWNL